MQTLIAKPYHPDQNLRAMAFDNERRCLLTGSRRVLSWCAEKKKDIVGHGTGLMSVIYNSIVDLLVSSDDEGTVRVWNVEDGTGAPFGPAACMHAQAQRHPPACARG
jgi:WD40 repeat protein